MSYMIITIVTVILECVSYKRCSDYPTTPRHVSSPTSTALELLRHTRSRKTLRFRNICCRHPFCNDVSALHCPLIPV